MNSSQDLPARKGGGKAILLTVLGEFVLPAGGGVWTSALIAAADALGIGERNARQALARIGDQGFIKGARHGRSVRWELTAEGRALLETGTKQIYDFGKTERAWGGEWLVAHCPVAESQRAIRNELRRDLGFLGFGELSASLLISPHPERETQLRAVLERLDLLGECTILRSETVDTLGDRQVADRAWNLDELAASYSRFKSTHDTAPPKSPQQAFVALVGLVHDWRRFPFTDPALPTSLLPDNWPGTVAASLFHKRHPVLASDAQDWFADKELSARPSSPNR